MTRAGHKQSCIYWLTSRRALQTRSASEGLCLSELGSFDGDSGLRSGSVRAARGYFASQNYDEGDRLPFRRAWRHSYVTARDSFYVGRLRHQCFAFSGPPMPTFEAVTLTDCTHYLPIHVGHHTQTDSEYRKSEKHQAHHFHGVFLLSFFRFDPCLQCKSQM